MLEQLVKKYCYNIIDEDLNINIQEDSCGQEQL
jgi:hypothetical protein